MSGPVVWLLCAADQWRDLHFLLEDEGLEPVHVPLLEAPLSTDARSLQAAAEQVLRFDDVVFTSPAAVRAFAEAVRQAGSHRHVRTRRCLALDERTRLMLARQGWPSAPVLEDASGSVLVIAQEPVDDRERWTQPDTTLVVACGEVPRVDAPEPAVIVVDTPSAAEALADLGVPAPARVVACSNAVAQVLAERGVAVWVQAERAEVDVIVAATMKALQSAPT